MPSTTYAAILPEAPDLDVLASRTDEVLAGLAGSAGIEDALGFVRTWETARCGVQDYASWVSLRFSQDTADAERVAQREAWEAAEPRWTELEISVKRALLEHPLRAELEAAIGPQAFALWASEVLAFAPEIKALLTEESKLSSEYTALLAGAKLEFQGARENLSTMARFRQHSDRAVRHGAEQVTWGWFAEQRPELDRIFDGLVRVRTEIASKLGADNFVKVGYDRMCRVDYDQADVERFRASVRDEIVPLCAKLVEAQAGRLGLGRLQAWDEYVQDPQGNPAPKGDGPWQVARAQEMFDAMGPELSKFFGELTSGDFVDLEAREGKAGGGFCTSFPGYGMPFIFANFNGTKGDVEVLTHEVGHAFQNWSSAGLWPCDFHWPTYESAEIHSMALEFLTWPEMERFFGEDAERFRRVHLTESLMFLPYGTAVDHFQHELYANPDLGPEGRHKLWQEMERTYLPWRDWGDLEHPAMGGRWQAQGHIFGAPFYYIDYVLAQTVALQFWALSNDNAEDALQRYVALCKRGGSQPFQALVRSAGLTSPFDEGCLSNAVARAREVLGV